VDLDADSVLGGDDEVLSGTHDAAQSVCRDQVGAVVRGVLDLQQSRQATPEVLR